MGLLSFFKSDKEDLDWDTIRSTEGVYPSNSISLLMTETETGKPATGWLDLAYKDYPYKKYCPYNLQFSVEVDESRSEDLDMGTIEDFFRDLLKKECVVHVVARVTTDFGMIMDMYIDNPEFAQATLVDLNEREDKWIEFGCGFKYDPKWKEYKRIASLVG